MRGDAGGWGCCRCVVKPMERVTWGLLEEGTRCKELLGCGLAGLMARDGAIACKLRAGGPPLLTTGEPAVPDPPMDVLSVRTDAGLSRERRVVRPAPPAVLDLLVPHAPFCCVWMVRGGNGLAQGSFDRRLTRSCSCYHTL